MESSSASCGGRRPPGDHASARRRLAGRAHRSDARCARISRIAARSGTQIVTADTAHGTNPASVTMAGYEPAKVTDRRARERRRRPSADAGRRAHRRPDADEPLDARTLRREHRGGRRGLPRRGSASLLRRREPERGLRDLAARRHGLRHRPLQPAQDLLPAPRRRRPRRRSDRRPGRPRAVPAASRWSSATDDGFWLDYDRPKSIGRCAASPATFGVFVRAYAFIRALRPRGLREMSEVAVLNANYLLARLKRGVRPAVRPPVHARVRRSPRAT